MLRGRIAEPGAVSVAVVLVFGVEKVVDLQAQSDAPGVSRAERVRPVEVRHAVGVERQRVVLVVREVLLADVLRVESRFESAVVEVENEVGDRFGRVGEFRGAQRYRPVADDVPVLVVVVDGA